MNTKVVYLTKSGNTKKLADCIAETLGVKAETIRAAADTEAEILFLGASVYWGGIDKKVREYIVNIDPHKVKEVVVFSTSAMTERAFPEIKKQLESRGIKVAEENFYCKGKFKFMHKDRPNGEDLKEAATFAKNVVAKRR